MCDSFDENLSWMCFDGRQSKACSEDHVLHLLNEHHMLAEFPDLEARFQRGAGSAKKAVGDYFGSLQMQRVPNDAKEDESSPYWNVNSPDGRNSEEELVIQEKYTQENARESSVDRSAKVADEHSVKSDTKRKRASREASKQKKRCVSARVACPTCNKNVSTSYLQQHIDSVHKKLRPHHCHLCGASFSEKGTLRKHLASVHS